MASLQKSEVGNMVGYIIVRCSESVRALRKRNAALQRLPTFFLDSSYRS